MIELRALGALELRQSAGPELHSVLTQPRRIALLCYLTLAAPRGFQRRDRLLTLFWPEHDAERARAALRQAVYFLRRSLIEAALVGRGDDELAVAKEHLWCDVVAFEEAIAQKRLQDAVKLYRGDLLAGFHVADAPGFEEWMEQERTRLRDLAAQAAATWTHEAQAAGHTEEALVAARRALELDPYDEPALRRLLQLLLDAGDRAGALRAFEAFRERFAGELELEPSSETAALVCAIRAQSDGKATVGSAGFATDKTAEHGGHNESHTVVNPGAEPLGDRSAQPVSTTWIDNASIWSRRGATRTFAVLGVATLLGVTAWYTSLRDNQSLEPDLVVVAPFENETGDADLERLSRMAADWTTNALQRLEGVRVVPTPTALHAWRHVQAEVAAGRVRDPLRGLAAETRARMVVSGNIYAAGDSLRLHAQLTDAERSRLLRSADAVGPSLPSLQGVEELGKRVMAAVAQELNAGTGGWDFNTMRPPTYDAYQEMLIATDRTVLLEWDQALPHLQRAAALDTSYAAPLVIAALAHMNLGQLAQADSLIRQAGRSPERLSQPERRVLDAYGAWIRRDWQASMLAFEDLARISPNPQWAFSVARMAQALNRPRETIEWLQKIDPDRSPMRHFTAYWQVLANAHHISGDHGTELKAARVARKRFPDLRRVLDLTEIPALIAHSQPNEAIRLLEQERPSLPNKAPGLTRLAAYRVTALELRAHGYSDKAQEILERIISQYRSTPPPEDTTFGTMFQFGEVLYLAEHWQEAHAVFGKLATERPGQIALQAYLALCAARLGMRADAERISQQLAGMKQPYLYGFHTFWRAQIAAVLGQKGDAVRLLQDALREGYGYNLWTHREQDFESLRTYPEYKRLVQPKG